MNTTPDLYVPKRQNPFVFGDAEPEFASVDGAEFGEWAKIYVEVTADNTTDVFTITSSWDNPFQNGQMVEFTSSVSLPTGISASTRYFIVSRTSTTFKVSTSSGGSPVNFSSDGSGTIRVYRYNGYTTGDLCENGAYVIESLLRDWVFREKDLELTTINSTSEFEVAKVLNQIDDDYYNEAYVYNVTQDEYDLIVDYSASGTAITTRSAHVGWNEGDKLFITNIQGNRRIDMLSFDRVGNTTDGTRKDWKFAFSHNTRSTATELLQELAFQLYCALIESGSRYRLIALDDTTVTATWTNPLKQDGREMFIGAFLPITSLFTDFTLNFLYDSVATDTISSYYVNPNGQSSGLKANLYLLPEAVRDNYRVEKKFEYSARHIYDGGTVESLMDKIVTHFTTQRHTIQWGGDCKNYIHYEVGDIIKVNYASLMPDALNNSARYMIVGKEIRPLRLGNPYIIFTLMQIN